MSVSGCKISCCIFYETFGWLGSTPIHFLPGMLDCVHCADSMAPPWLSMGLMYGTHSTRLASCKFCWQHCPPTGPKHDRPA